MPYYAAGDYYQGDYYQGDFLGIGRAIKKIGGAVLRTGVGFLTGGPAGAAVALVGGGQHPNLPAPVQTFAAPMNGAFPTLEPAGTQLMSQPVIPTAFGPASGPSLTESLFGGGPSTALVPHAVVGRPRGMHLNKATYETRGGGTSRWPHGLLLHQKGTTYVTNRRMNVGNARALKRSLRRIGGFARLARRVMHFTHPKAGKGHFKVGRKRAR